MRKTLKAFLRKNLLTEDPNDYTAVVSTNGSKTVDDIVDEMQREGMEIKRETVIDIISRFNRIAADMVVAGTNVSTGLIYMRPIIKGVFYDKTWSPETNSVYVTISQGPVLREAVAETDVEILSIMSDPMEIISVTDLTTEKVDGTLSKGLNAEIKGTLIKIAGDDAASGIVFKNIATKEETKLTVQQIPVNDPSRLIILVPATLVAGDYELTVTTQYSSGNNLLKQARSYTFGNPVIIS